VTLRQFLAALAMLAALPGCDRLDRNGMLLMVDESYTAELLLSDKDGIVSPDGLLWADGRLYIADEGGSAVRVWSQGEGLRTLATAEDGLQSPEDLALGAGGALYVTDDDSGGVWRIDPAGGARRLVEPRPGLTGTEAIVRTPGGAMLVGDGVSGRIFRLREDGALAPLGLRIAKPESFAFDGVGNLYIADNRDDVLYLVTRDGRLRRPIAGRDGFSPESIHWTGESLLITDSDNGRLYRFTPEDGLETLAVLGGELANVQGVASDAEGNIYLTVQTDLRGGRGYLLRLVPGR
jgi:sugar lactone lactonase YvrE